MLNHNEELKAAVKNNTAHFGTLESWLLFRLRLGVYQTGEPISKNIEHISDISNCSATGFCMLILKLNGLYCYKNLLLILDDPFTRTWADWAIKLFSFKVIFNHILVELSNRYLNLYILERNVA